ncbi:hypothetical protein BST28_17495 [Mycolicibacter kumamotonensis]|uniref:Uncharacterized protein n=1 Tax=Mycolicibacter kumamotonensis TaxID=354243 RepID=A0A1X0DZ15_9MYCO|nr:hypothetical protein [Mycolicibacter kumamotonensis]ORA77597.1 hypothetical protein BST28_17495 [Mycolicibacter kumamotonensis]
MFDQRLMDPAWYTPQRHLDALVTVTVDQSAAWREFEAYAAEVRTARANGLPVPPPPAGVTVDTAPPSHGAELPSSAAEDDDEDLDGLADEI